MELPSRIERRYVRIIALATMLIIFLPLFVYPQSLFPYVFPRTIVFRVLVEIAGAAYLLLALRQPMFRPRSSPLLWSLLAFVVAMALSVVGGVEWYRSFWGSIERSEGLITWLHFLVFFVVVTGVFRERRDWRPLFTGMLIAGWLQILYAAAQYFQLPFTVLTTESRLNGTIGNPSFFAAYLYCIIFVAAWTILEGTSRLRAAASWPLIFASLFFIWQSQTRGAILGIGLGIVIFAGRRIWRSGKAKHRTAFVAAVMTAALCFVFLVSQQHAPWVLRNPTLVRLASLSLADTSSQNRLFVWKAGLKGFQDRPFVGWGVENFQAAFNTHFDPAITEDIGSRPWYDRAHNVAIEVLTTTGILGFLSYAAIYLAAWLLLRRARKKGTITDTQHAFGIAYGIAYLFQNLLVFDTLNSYLMLVLILAYLSLLPVADRENTIDDTSSKRSLPLALRAIVVMITLLTLYVVNIRPSLANMHVVRAVTTFKNDPAGMQREFEKAFRYSPPAQQELRFILIQHTRNLVNEIGLTETTFPLVTYAITESEKAVVASPYTLQNHLVLAEMYLLASRINPAYLLEAERVTLEALERSPKRFQSYSMLGRLAMDQRDFKRGIEYLQKAVDLNESFAEAHWNLAIAYILSGQRDAGHVELDRAHELGFSLFRADNIQRLLAAYQDAKDIEGALQWLETVRDRFPDDKQYQEYYEGLSRVRAELDAEER
ncbi:MAG: O-antigen ligase family protein [Patescibacteria group bacterium]